MSWHVNTDSFSSNEWIEIHVKHRLYLLPQTGCSAECADGVTGAGGRHTPFSLEVTRDQERQTPGRFPGPRPLPGPGVHPGQTGEPTTESRPGGSRTPGRPWCPLESVASCLLPVLTPSQAFTITSESIILGRPLGYPQTCSSLDLLPQQTAKPTWDTNFWDISYCCYDKECLPEISYMPRTLLMFSRFIFPALLGGGYYYPIFIAGKLRLR